MIQKFKKIVIIVGLICATASSAQANNLSISNVSMASRDPSSKSLLVQFDIAWNNSWHNKINHDAIWLTVRLNNSSEAITNKKICQITASGINPAGTSTGTATSLEFYIPNDKKGAFLRRSSNGNISNISSQRAQLTIDYNSCGFSDNDNIYVSVFGLEMVFIPQGDFYAGDGDDNTTASLDQGSNVNEPAWHVTSENTIPVNTAASGVYRYVSGNNAGEYSTGTSFNIPSSFPKGYGSFYVMKYEITEGQWVEFFNSLGSASSRANRDITDNSHKASDAVDSRNTISCSGTPISCTTIRPSRAVSYLSWMDLSAFLDWAALRPITELEFEKIARGPLQPLKGEYVWGTTEINFATSINGSSEDGTETTDVNSNANYNNVTLSGGDASSGPLRSGIFASSSTNRITSGGSYYGVLDLSGNLKEHIVTIGNPNGLSFDGENGDGILSLNSGFEGNANASHWPGIDVILANGVTGASGSGFRGGSWSDNANILRISDRTEAALTTTSATSSFGGRGARTYDGN